jgi:hypothetical protein
MPPPLPPQSTISYAVADPCGDLTPRPTDLFVGEDGRPEVGDCPLPMDPLDAAVAIVERDQRAPLDAEVFLPVDGSLDLGTLSSTVTLDFSATSSASGALPPVALLELSETATRTVDISTRFDTMRGGIVVSPSRDLVPRRRYVVVATTALRDTGSPAQALAPSPAVRALTGGEAIAEGAYEGLGAQGAARLERMRRALRPALRALEAASPAVTAGDIVSIHAFTTRPGPDLLENVVQRYEAAVAAGVYPYRVRIESPMLAPSEVYGPAVPASAYANVERFVSGVIEAPRMLDANLRLRPGWATTAETVDVPFLLSVPRGGAQIPVAVQVVGFGRSRIDARALANDMGGGPRGGVLAIELRCHGRRSPGLDGRCGENRTEAEAQALLDEDRNNENPLSAENRPDGIPDASGVGFFPGDPRQLRDTQIAAVIEIAHVVGSLREGSAWSAESIEVDRAGVHLLAQGYTALPAAAAAALASNPLRPRTVIFPAGGADLDELILEGATAQRQAFTASLPGTIGPAQADTLLGRLADYLAPVRIGAFGSAFVERYTVQGRLRGVLLPHPEPGDPGVTQFVTEDARAALAAGLSIPSRYVSRHLPRCDDYFIFPCRLGQPVNLLEDARRQISGFIDSNGQTVPPPGR